MTVNNNTHEQQSINTSPVLRGRPSSFSPEIAFEICERIGKGETITAICRDNHLPVKSTVYGWLLKAQEVEASEDLQVFSNQYARAREQQAESFFDECIEIADDSTNDTQLDDEGKPITNFDNIQRSRLRIDTRKWVAGKLRPKKYGESMTMKGDLEAPLTQKIVVTHHILDALTMQQLEKIREIVQSKRAEDEKSMIDITPPAKTE